MIEYIKNQIRQHDVKYVVEVDKHNPDKVQRFLLDNGIKWKNGASWDRTKDILYFKIYMSPANNDYRMLLSTSKNFTSRLDPSDILISFDLIKVNKNEQFINNLFEDII